MKNVPFLLFFCCCMFSCAMVEAQHEIIEEFVVPDSLSEKSYEDIHALFSRYAPYKTTNGDSAIAQNLSIVYVKKALLEEDSLNIARGYYMLSAIMENDLFFLDKSIEFTENCRSEYYPSLSHIGKFLHYYNRGMYRKSYDEVMKAKESLVFIPEETLLNQINGYITILNAKWGDKEQGIKEFKNYLEFIRKPSSIALKNTSDSLYWHGAFVNTHYNIAVAYYETYQLLSAENHLDSVLYYGKLNNVDYALDNYLGLKGGILYKQGKYHEALEYLNGYLLNGFENDNYGISRSSVVKGLALWELNEKELAIHSLAKADSLYQITQDEFEELGDGYKRLIAYYKETDNTEKQLEYLNKLLAFDEEINANYLEIAPSITRNYTIPELLKEKENVIASLNKSNQINEHKKSVYYTLLLILSAITSFFVVQRQIFKKRYTTLIRKQQDGRNKIDTSRDSTNKRELNELDALQIELIARGLEEFEKSQGFLNEAISLRSLAQSMNTNSSYLSKYINAIKGFNFSHYIGNLRIHYIVDRLGTDIKIRSYTIEAIASEAGFSNVRSFSNHFKRVTGINTSYFLKKLQKENPSIPTTSVPAPQRG